MIRAADRFNKRRVALFLSGAVLSGAMLLSAGCAVEAGPGYGPGPVYGDGIGVDYYEPYGGVYGGWGSNYYVGPYRNNGAWRGGSAGGPRSFHGNRGGGAPPGLPSGGRGGAGGGGGHGGGGGGGRR